MEIYWEAVARATTVLILGGEGYLFYRLIKPFLESKKYAGFIGAIYFAVMVILYFIPPEIDSMEAHAAGIMTAFAITMLIDWRNIEQKLFLTTVFYLLEWVSHGIAVIPRRWLFGIFPFFSAENDSVLMFVVYVMIEICYISLRFFLLKFLVCMVKRVYNHKEENMTKRELVLMLSTPLSVMAGYCGFEFFSDAFLDETKQYIWNVHTEYWWIKAVYQVISVIAILMSVFVYQKIRSSHRKEKEDAVLLEQIENMKQHIAEVEVRYRDIRRLRHDMGNHVMTLESLFLKNERREAEEYLVHLRDELKEASPEIKSGNPVTDVILTESKKEAGERGITFVCDFHFPEETKINAFDISVILNNALNNAIEGAGKSENPYIRILSYRKKNAYMIEVENNFTGELYLDEESGLPITMKGDKQEHGYGLVSIRAVAQKYFGDIDIRQDGKKFILSVLLMVK